MIFLAVLAALACLVLAVIVMISLRRIVAPNEVHIVQSGNATTSYGKDTSHGNTYYEWPAWVPLFGITKTILPVSVFDITLKNYEAYDQGRVPFVVDVVGFFRIQDTNLAAQRVQQFSELEEQLTAVTQGAIRTVLASHDIDSIMTDRSKFGVAFTSEVEEQLKNWGVVPVKNLELMDIRDTTGNDSIHSIMQKKKSLIASQSRIEVAKNEQDAKVAEINANQAAEMQRQIALEAVGTRTAQKDQTIGIATQKSQQAVQEESRVTKEKEMAVIGVAQRQQAAITKDVQITQAEQTKQVTILKAEGELESQKKAAEAVQIAGIAEAEAEKAKQLAPVQAQITLAKEIGENAGYQKYLINLREIEANQAVGVAQAGALEKADVKVIANTGTPAAGIASVRDLFSANGGQQIGAMLEGLANTDHGKAVLDIFSGGKKSA